MIQLRQKLWKYHIIVSLQAVHSIRPTQYEPNKVMLQK